MKLFIVICALLMINNSLSFTKVLVPAVYKEYEKDGAVPEWISDQAYLKANNYSVVLYQKLEPDGANYVHRNRGTEGAIYLRYIVEHYDDFPDVAMFVHAHPHDHQPKFLDYLKCISPNATYMNINGQYILRNTEAWPRIEVWMEQCWRDVLKIIWGLEDNIEEFGKRLPWDRPIMVYFGCCQQFVLSKSMVHKRPLEVWKKLLHIIGEQDVCHVGKCS